MILNRRKIWFAFGNTILMIILLFWFFSNNWNHVFISKLNVFVWSIRKHTSKTNSVESVSDSWAVTYLTNNSNKIPCFTLIPRCHQWLILVSTMITLKIKTSWSLSILISIIFIWIIFSLNWKLDTLKRRVCVIFELLIVIYINVT